MTIKLDEIRTLLVISPHLDDAALSVGGLIEAAVARGTRVVIATTFTADSPPPGKISPFAIELHGIWKLGDNPYAHRRAEDVVAVGLLGAELRHGGLHDALYRADDAGAFLYPTRRSIFARPVPGDRIGDKLAGLLARWIDELAPDLVLAPLAVGRHIDHVVVTNALQRLAASMPIEVALYEDIPYATGIVPVHAPDTVEAALARTPWSVTGPQLVAVQLERKLAAIGAYVSQIVDIFPNGLPFRSVVDRYMRLGPDGSLAERIWLTSRPGARLADR